MKKEKISTPIKLAFFNFDNNMGDALNEILIPKIFNIPVKHCDFKHCDLVGVGSILESAISTKTYLPTKIWGSGFIQEHLEELNLDQKYEIYALRGRKSKEIFERNISKKIECVLADPGLLAPMLFDKKEKKEYDLGIVPHYVDKDNPVFKEIQNQIPNSIMIDVLSGSLNAINQIRKCRYILSTSLHGLIIADSFNIPNLWVKTSDLILGNDFKFHDYYSSFGLKMEPYDLRTNSFNSLDIIRQSHKVDYKAVQKKQKELIDSFPYQSLPNSKINEKMKKRYTVLTYNVENYELVREIEEKDPEAEYILVTDCKDVKSNTWTVVLDEAIQGESGFDKVCDIRLNAFKYCNTDICLRVDASVKIKHSLKELIDIFEKGNYDIALLPHPTRYNFADEFNTWIDVRNYNVDQAIRILSFFKENGYDLNYKGLLQTGLLITRNTSLTKSIIDDTYTLAKQLGENGHMERIDQVLFSYVMNSKYNDIKVLPLSEQVLHSYYMQIYQHGTNDVNAYVDFDLTRKDKKYLFNKLVECKYLKTPAKQTSERENELLKNLEKIQEENNRLKLELKQVRNSNSFKLGQKILYIPGLLKHRK